MQLTSLELSPETNMLTVDLECWHQIICRNLTGRHIGPYRGLVRTTEDLLRLFRDRGVHATFFVVGQIAEALPDLVRRIDGDGHEIAAHGYSHTPLFRLTRDEIRSEVEKTVGLLSGIIGKPILGFRAPEFSISSAGMGILEILADHGIKYDSSIFPIGGARYGIPDFPVGAVRVGLSKGALVEIPLSTIRMGGRNLPVSGGGYMRLLPYPLMRRAVERVNRAGRAFVVYIHPYEFGSERLALHAVGCEGGGLARLLVEAKANLFRASIPAKLAGLLGDFRFSSIVEVLGDALTT